MLRPVTDEKVQHNICVRQACQSDLITYIHTSIHTVAGVEIAAGCRRKLIRFIKEPAGLKSKEEKTADSI